MTPDKNFRMKSTIKTMLTMFKGSKEQRNGWKKMFIDAQLCEEAAKRAALKSKEVESTRNTGKTRGAVAPE
jgi:hypothetical protein